VDPSGGVAIAVRMASCVIYVIYVTRVAGYLNDLGTRLTIRRYRVSRPRHRVFMTQICDVFFQSGTIENFWKLKSFFEVARPSLPPTMIDRYVIIWKAPRELRSESLASLIC